MERVARLVLQPQMRQRRALGDVDFEHRIVQIGALADGDFDQRQRARRAPSRMRWRGWNATGRPPRRCRG